MNLKRKLTLIGLIAIVCLLGPKIAAILANQPKVARAAAKAARAATLATKADCLANKGIWTHGGGIPHPGAPLFCMLPADDAGKRCSSSSECDSELCAAANVYGTAHGERSIGACAAFSLGGCVTSVENGQIQQTICSD